MNKIVSLENSFDWYWYYYNEYRSIYSLPPVPRSLNNNRASRNINMQSGKADNLFGIYTTL